MSATPNASLIAARTSRRWSQDDLVSALEAAHVDAGTGMGIDKRTVQRWEAGVTRKPRPPHARALESVFGAPIEALGFDGIDQAVVANGHGGHDIVTAASPPLPNPKARLSAPGSFTGVWLSRYEYYSSGRDEHLVGLHYVVALQHGNRLTVRSLEGASLNPDSPLAMDLTIDRNIVTGTWTEHTASDGYYRGAVYHGAIQMLVEPTGRRMRGKWVGFGKQLEINSGPWELAFCDPSTAKATLARYSHPPQT